jgi:transposase, IS5 family
MGQLGFFDLDARYRGLDAKKDPLVFPNAVVPWEDFRAQLSAVWRKPDEERKNAAGRKPWAQLEHRVLKKCSAPNTCVDARGL